MSTQQTISQKLTTALAPTYLDIVNESDNHSGPAGRESHFKITVVSEAFNPLNLIKRHQTIYTLLRDELAGSIHALALHTYTPTEWQTRMNSPDSPNCLGGSATTG